jgi:pimeloyl-ACP methyl ester carboxylesterase
MGVRPPSRGTCCLWNRPPPAAIVKMFLTGGDSALAEATRRAIAGVRGEIIAARISAVLRVDVTAELERLSCPVLYLQAKRDRMVGARSAMRISALKPSVTVVQVCAPHLLLQANPHEAWSHVAPFLPSAVDFGGPRST